MQGKPFSWNTEDGLRIHAMHWPHPNPQALILLRHGMGEHIGRYDSWLSFFHERGYAIMASDVRGHGQSEGKRGHTTDLEAYLKELDELLKNGRSAYPDLPVVLYGHSAGGGTALYYTLDRKPPIAALVATSPWINLAFSPPAWQLTLARIVRNIFPAFTQRSGLDPRHISSLPEEVKAYREDQLVHDRITPATVLSMMSAGEWLDQYAGGMPVPTLLMHGLADRITSAEASRRFAERNSETQFKGWEERYHELQHEWGREEILGFAADWISRQIDPK